MKQIDFILKNVGTHLVDYLDSLMKEGLLTKERFELDFSVSWKDFKTDIKRGARYVRLEHLLRANELYNYNISSAVNRLSSYEPTDFRNTITDRDAEYEGSASLREHVAATTKNLLEKHKVDKGQLARERLSKSRQVLYRRLTGETKVSLEEAIMICEDLGESMDVYRTGPLPKGHMLTEINLQRDMINSQKEVIKRLHLELSELKRGGRSVDLEDESIDQ